MSATEESIVEFLIAKAKATWEDPENPRPYLLSFAGQDFREAGIDYQSVLAGERLKAFVDRKQGDDGYRVVKHPTQPAKIGLVPWHVEFQFDEADATGVPSRTRTRSAIGRGSVLLEFLDALATLPDGDLDDIVIPTRVLVKLAKKK